MKNNLKKFRSLLILLILIVGNSCETEKLTESVSNYNSEKQKFKKVNLDEIPFIKNALKTKTQSLQGKSAATYLSLINPENIIIETDSVGRKSYTFSLNLEEVETLTNLVIKETDQGLKYDLVKYASTNLELWKESIKKDEFPSIAVSIEVESLEILNSTDDRSCIQTQMVWTCPAEIHDLENASSCSVEGPWHLAVQYSLVPCSGTQYATSSTPYSGNTSSSGGTTPNIGANFLNNLHNTNLAAYNYLNQHLDMKNQILAYLQLNMYSNDSVDFANWGANYLRNNQTVTFATFQNQFMGTTEGPDGDYDAIYWDNPDLTFPAQNLPTWANFEANYPKHLTGPETYQFVGGPLYAWHLADPEDRSNACALRVSRALNYSGVTIPAVNGTFKGGDGKNYFVNARALNAWMRKTFGVTPTNPNHYNITKAEAGVHGVELPTLLSGIKGIYSMVSPQGSYWASGHADLLYDNATCDNNCHFYDGDILYIDVWELQ